MLKIKLICAVLMVLIVAAPVCKLAFILGGAAMCVAMLVAAILVAAVQVSDVLDNHKHNEWRERVIFGKPDER